MRQYRVKRGDCREVLKKYRANRFDVCVTDPPWGIQFMNRDWDHEVPGPDYWSEVFRVLKPGSYLLAWCGTKKFHRLMCAIEDSGFVLRDTFMHMYGQGFAKGANMSLAFDKANGLVKTRGRAIRVAGVPPEWANDRDQWGDVGGAMGQHQGISDEAREWQGWGTGLKPCWEPIVLAQKPLDGSFTDNIRKWGVGALNIDACRIATDWSHRSESWKRSGHSRKANEDKIAAPSGAGIDCNDLGWWPPNALVTADEYEDPRQLLEALAGATLSRIFWHSKASRAEREAGLEHLPARRVNDGRRTKMDTPYQRGETLRRNSHPTVKPVAVLRKFIELTTSSGNLVLDPFCGSGSTGVAALELGRRFLGVDLDEKKTSVRVARARCLHALERMGQVTTADLEHGGKGEVQLGLGV